MGYSSAIKCWNPMSIPRDRPRVVVINDTSTRSHHGCARVMRLLLDGLDRHGLEVIARSPARHDWTSGSGFLATLGRADLVVINAEGTLHHGRPAGAKLLSVIPDMTTRGIPVAVVNALWQDNPQEWAELLSGVALVAARDAQSGAELAAHLGASRANSFCSEMLFAGRRAGASPLRRRD
jgi:hypothetical protein